MCFFGKLELIKKNIGDGSFYNRVSIKVGFVMHLIIAFKTQ
jgi:hypothetical protein